METCTSCGGALDGSRAASVRCCTSCSQTALSMDGSRVTLVGGEPGPALASLELSAEFREAYELVELLGTGAMGMVVRAVQRAGGRAVAIKFMRAADSDDAVQRFIREGRAMAKVRHSAVAQVYDLEEIGTNFKLRRMMNRGKR